MSVVELPLTVFVVDDEPPARNRLKELLTDCGEQLPLAMIGEASNGLEALDKLSLLYIRVVKQLSSVKLFSKLSYFIFGYFDPVNIFFANKNKSFSG